MSENNEPASTMTRGDDDKRFLTFMLMDQDFGIEILRVQEIRNFTSLTPIPNMPPSIKGVMNLRGTVVPIVDLRSKFGMPDAEYDRFTVIIVVTIGTKVMGLIVDGVSDVLNVVDDDIEEAPEVGSGADTGFIWGIAKAGERMITLLDLDELLDVGAISV